MILVPDLADIEANATSSAEKRVARLLKSVEDDPHAVAFHSVILRSHPYKQQAEADFIILWRGIVLVVEVKGGGVSKQDGAWYSIDRTGRWNKLSESPMEQAKSAAYALKGILRGDGLGGFRYEAIVITPDIHTPIQSHEWHPENWLSGQSMSVKGLASALDAAIFRHTRAPMNVGVVRELEKRLFGNFARLPAIDVQRGTVLDEQNRATEGQAAILAQLSRNPRILVSGGAGTGKSLVLAEAAKQESDQGRSVLITFHSSGLIPFFKALIQDRRIVVSTSDQIPPRTSFDVVLVDEAQDLMNAEAMDRINSALVGGLTHGRWRLFLDHNNQAHIDGTFDDEVFALVRDEGMQLQLDTNVRNTKAVVQLVQKYLAADVGDAGIVHGEKVHWSKRDAATDVASAETIAEQLVSGGIARDTIWIIAVNSTETPRITSSGITITNPKHAKGLECDLAIVCDLPTDFDDASIAAFYVAVTRPRVALYILASKSDRKNLLNLHLEQGKAS